MKSELKLNPITDKLIEDISSEAISLLREGKKQEARKYLMDWLNLPMRFGIKDPLHQPRGKTKAPMGMLLFSRLRGKAKGDDVLTKELTEVIRDVSADVKLVGKVGIPFKGHHDNNYFRTKNK